MAESVNIGLTVEAWADIVVKEWLNKIRLLNIEGSSNLVNSFIHHVISRSDGDPSHIEFAFEYYGKMVNWGVGKGVTLDERDMMMSSGFTTRKPKPWYDDVFFTQLRVLSHLMAEKYGQRAALIVKANLEKTSFG